MRVTTEFSVMVASGEVTMEMHKGNSMGFHFIF